MAKVCEVTLLATTSLIGEGSVDDPIRRIYELWMPDGKMVCSSDPNARSGRVCRLSGQFPLVLPVRSSFTIQSGKAVA